jgi:4-amino-4-deoxy-L-arabinose transferase-like glycosyltransferase
MTRVWQHTLVRHQLVIVFLAGLVFFTNLGSAALFDEDEPKNAVCGREMFERSDWLVPTFNAELRTDKPILIYWLMLCSYSVWGVNEFAARFGSSTLAVLTSLLTYHLGRKLFDAETGFWAAGILCTCLMYAAVGRAVTPDSTLICCITAAMCVYVWGTARRHGGRFGQPATEGLTQRVWSEYMPATWWEVGLMYVCLGLAVLAKGPIGVLLPCTIIGLQLLVRRQLDHRWLRSTPKPRPMWLRVLRTISQTLKPKRVWQAMLVMRVPWGALAVSAVCLPWYVAVGYATDGAWLTGFLGGHNVGRFLSPMENHRGPIVYYIPVVLLGCLPWSVLLPLAVWRLISRFQQPGHHRAGWVLVSCWAGAWIGFFSLAQTKLPNYVLPAYPALALLLAGYVVEWQRLTGTEWQRGFEHACRALAGLGAVLAIAGPIALSILLPAEQWLGAIGLIPLAGATYAWWLSRQQQRSAALSTFATTSVALVVLVVGIAPSRVARHQDGPRLGAIVREYRQTLAATMGWPQAVPLATYDYFAPNLVFYSDQPVLRLKQREIRDFFESSPQGLLLTRADRLNDLQSILPPGVAVLKQEPRFLRRHNLVLLGQPSQVAALPDAPQFR